MKIARNPGFSGRSGEWYSPSPAPSLRELARPTGVTEGVSFDGSTGPTVYPPVIINSEIFDLLRATKYTPSASLRSAAPSGREPGMLPFIEVLAKIQRFGRFSSPLRNSEVGRFHHSSGYSLKSNVAGDFHRPYGKGGGYTGRFGHKNKKSRAKTSSKRQKNQLTNAAI